MKSLFATIIITFFTAAVFAQTAGDLDNSFGGDGRVQYWYPAPTLDGGVSVTTIQLDGKIITGGTLDVSGWFFWDAYLSRFNTDGSLDSSFGYQGFIVEPGGTGAAVSAVSVQQDGKILVVELLGGEQTLTMRYNSNGTDDSDFVVNPYPTSTFYERAVAQQSNEKIIVGGTGLGNYFTLVRYNSDGTLDTTFSSGGFAITQINQGCGISCLAILPDDKILAGGSTYNGMNPELALVRYNTNGTLDSTFGQDGITTLNYVPGINKIAIQSDGKILVLSSEHILTLIRYNENGSLDSTFGSNGISTINSFAGTASFALGLDGNIYAAGTSDYDFELIAINTDGSVNTSFGLNGVSTTDFDNNHEYAGGIGIEPDGNIVVTGASGLLIELARYLSELNVGIINFSSPQSSPLIYPNPIHQTETLEYTLTKNESLTIALYDVDGKLIRNFISNEQRAAGEHKETLNIGELTSGNYFLTISDGSQKMSVKVVKQ